MVTVDNAIMQILGSICALEQTSVALDTSLGMVLAQDVSADISNPPFDNSAVDGYAVIAHDTSTASIADHCLLTCIGEVAAGSVFQGAIAAGQCVRVMTGAQIPAGADAMVMREDSLSNGDQVSVTLAAAPGDHIRRAGSDIRKGDVVLRAGTLICSSEIAMLAAMGYTKVPCHRRPRVAIFSTGDELVSVDQYPGPGKIRDSNRHTMEALVREAGAEIHSSVHLADDPVEIESALRLAAGLDGSLAADVIISSGGVSVGDHDHIKPVLEKLGKMDIWRINMKPGKPLAYGSISNTQFFGLPGNPVSTMVTFELFVRPALWKLAGRRTLQRPSISADLEHDIVHAPGREEFVRATVKWDGHKFLVSANSSQGSGMFSSMIGSNALLVVPKDADRLPKGSSIPAILIGPFANTQAGGCAAP